jgi:hypothetical protein
MDNFDTWSFVESPRLSMQLEGRHPSHGDKLWVGNVPGP